MPGVREEPVSAPRFGLYSSRRVHGVHAADPGRRRINQRRGMSPQGDKKWVIGVDLGGTNIVVGVLPIDGGDGEVLALKNEPTDAERGAKYVVDKIVLLIEEARAEVVGKFGGSRSDFAGIGIGAPGPLHRPSGTVIQSPNLGWRNFPLRDLVSNAVNLPAILDNDANCATYGEWWLGAGRNVDTLIGLTLGTGIGGGIVLNRSEERRVGKEWRGGRRRAPGKEERGC